MYDEKNSKPRLRLWEVGQKFHLGSPLSTDELNGTRERNNSEAVAKSRRGRNDPEAVAKKSVSAVAASKKLKHAKSIIEGVGRGVFPAFAKGT